MNILTIKAATAAVLWAVAVGAAGVLGDVSSSPGWIALVGCAVAPPLIMMRYWNYPEETMSESIQRVRR